MVLHTLQIFGKWCALLKLQHSSLTRLCNLAEIETVYSDYTYWKSYRKPNSNLYLLGNFGGLYLVYPNQINFGKEMPLFTISAGTCFNFSRSVLECPYRILSMEWLMSGFVVWRLTFDSILTLQLSSSEPWYIAIHVFGSLPDTPLNNHNCVARILYSLPTLAACFPIWLLIWKLYLAFISSVYTIECLSRYKFHNSLLLDTFISVNNVLASRIFVAQHRLDCWLLLNWTVCTDHVFRVLRVP